MRSTRWQAVRDWFTLARRRLTYCPRFGHVGKYPAGYCLNCGKSLRVPWSLDDQ